MLTPLLLTASLFTQQHAEENYQISKAQLDAFETLRLGHAQVLYPWTTNGESAFSKGIKLPSVAQLRGRVPVVGIRGDAFWTDERTLKAATAFPDVTYLNLSYCCRLSDNGIKELTKLKSLNVLVLYRNHARYGGNLILPMIEPEKAKQLPQALTDQSIEQISRMNSLRVLYLADNDFSEEAILKLGRLKNLEHLVIDSGQLSMAALRALQTRLQDCQIEVWNREPQR